MKLSEKRIVVTGGKGFLGQHLLKKLQEKGCENVHIVDLPDYNLVERPDIKRMYTTFKPDIVIHLAAKVGGIGFNQQNPATLFYENTMMGTQLIHEGYLHGIEKFVAIGTICAYPKFTPVPFKEDDIWNGYPEETNAPYGLAKKMMLVQSKAYRQQYGFNSIFLLPVNLYGPGDNFTFTSSHVIPALIRKFHLANLLAVGDFASIRHDFLRNKNGSEIPITKESTDYDILQVLAFYGISCKNPRQPSSDSVNVEIWGTGKATREFFYVDDAANAIVLATESYNKSDPVNIGAGFEISITHLVELLIALTGFKGTIVWNTSKPDGQPRRMLDTSRARLEFRFESQTSFQEGLRRTNDWYVSQSTMES
jgi:GDP-L-fucose synthase